jgi:hypothetical protein
MKWAPKISVAPPRPVEPYVTQEQEWHAWMARVHRRGKPNTKRNLTMYTRPLYEMFHPALVTKLGEDDMRNFLATLEPKCNSLMNGDEPTCKQGLDIATCPMLTGAVRESCSKYHALRVGGVLSYLHCVSQMYEWFLEEQRLKDGNPMLPVLRDYKARHRSTIDRLADNPDRRDLTLDEVRTLVLGSPPSHAIVYFLCAKFLLRIHEGLRMSFDPQYYDLEEGLMVVPPGLPDEPHKRRGNHTVILDREAKNYITRYRETFWEPRVRRDDNGKAVTQRIALTAFGLPYRGKYAENNFNQQALQKDAVRLGIMLGDEKRGQRATSHCFRSFGVTYANERKCPQIDGWILRGDKVSGPAGRYDNYRPRLAELYRLYGPVLGI